MSPIQHGCYFLNNLQKDFIFDTNTGIRFIFKSTNRVIPQIWATCVNWPIRSKFRGTFRDTIGHLINQNEMTCEFWNAYCITNKRFLFLMN